MEYLPLYSAEQARRHDVRPGMTGWAQVNGRNALSWEEKFRLDIWYVDRRSMMLDLKILWATIVRVIKRDGINAPGEVTMSPFRGSEKACGWKDPIIFEFAKIVKKENFSIGLNSQIDDFTFINAGERTKIGRFVHIASFCSVVGGGELEMEDFVGLSAGCRIITGSDNFYGEALTNPTVPPKFTLVDKGKVYIKRHAILGTNVIVFPNVTIGEGAALGAGCIVRKNVEPWGIYVGADCRRIKSRPKEKIERLEAELLRHFQEPHA
jgi:galactoside O-acetyltransferase